MGFTLDSQADSRLSRRQILHAAGSGFLLSPLRAAAEEATGRWKRLQIRYKTGPKALRRVLPPPLEPDESAHMIAEYSLIEAISGGERSQAVSFQLAAEVRYRGLPGLYQVLGVTNDDRRRIEDREALGFPTKDGMVRLIREEQKVSASVTRRGRRIHEVSTKLGPSADTPSSLTNRHHFAFRYRLHPSWDQELLDGDVELWRVDADRLDSSALGEVAGWIAEPGGTTMLTPEASLEDPIVELEPQEVLAVRYSEHGWPARLPFRPRASGRMVTVPSKRFKPHLFASYSRPISAGKTWEPAGWPSERTAWKLTPEERDNYQARGEKELRSTQILDLHFLVSPDMHREILPPECNPGMRPVMRLMAIRTERSDISEAPFTEVWLLGFCWGGEGPSWFALSHIAGEGGDVIFGRETLGYPSKSGQVDLSVSPGAFLLTASRKGRRVLEAQGSLRGVATGMTLGELECVGLRARPFEPGGFSEVRFVRQPWYFQGYRQLVDLETLRLKFPEDPGAHGGPPRDPWFEVAAERVIRGEALGNARMQREPGRLGAQLRNSEAFYRERCDGLLPGVDPVDALPPTFRAFSSDVRS